MSNKDFLSIGTGEIKNEKRLYTITAQDKIKTRFSAKFLAWLIASFLSFKVTPI